MRNQKTDSLSAIRSWLLYYVLAGFHFPPWVQAIGGQRTLLVEKLEDLNQVLLLLYIKIIFLDI